MSCSSPACFLNGVGEQSLFPARFARGRHSSKRVWQYVGRFAEGLLAMHRAGGALSEDLCNSIEEETYLKLFGEKPQISIEGLPFEQFSEDFGKNVIKRIQQQSADQEPQTIRHKDMDATIRSISSRMYQQHKNFVNKQSAPSPTTLSPKGTLKFTFFSNSKLAFAGLKGFEALDWSLMEIGPLKSAPKKILINRFIPTLIIDGLGKENDRLEKSSGEKAKTIVSRVSCYEYSDYIGTEKPIMKSYRLFETAQKSDGIATEVLASEEQTEAEGPRRLVKEIEENFEKVLEPEIFKAISWTEIVEQTKGKKLAIVESTHIKQKNRFASESEDVAHRDFFFGTILTCERGRSEWRVVKEIRVAPY